MKSSDIEKARRIKDRIKELETLKDKCVDLMLENADYVWDEMSRETAKKRANKRKWRAK